MKHTKIILLIMLLSSPIIAQKAGRDGHIENFSDDKYISIATGPAEVRIKTEGIYKHKPLLIDGREFKMLNKALTALDALGWDVVAIDTEDWYLLKRKDD